MCMKKIVSYILLIVWMIFIFMLSHQTSEVSGGASGSLLYDTLSFIYGIFGLNTANLYDLIEIIHEPIREIMHALEYFILGILAINALYQSGVNKNIVLYSILFCLIYSISDEVHQLFISGRTFQFLDLFMDFIGYMIGIFITQFIIKITFKKKV